MQLFQVFKRLLFAHELHQGGDHGVSGAAGRRVGRLDLVFVFGLEQIAPGLGHRQLFLGQQLGVVAKTQRTRVDAHRLVARLRSLLLRPVVQLRQRGRLVFQGQVLFGGLQVWVTGAAEPDVGFGVGALGQNLRQRFARALGGHVDLDALALLEGHRDHAAPSRLGRANHVDLGVLRLHGQGARQQKRRGQQEVFFHGFSPMQR